MKKIILSTVAIAALTLSSFAQAPESMKYQSVVRDASANVIANQAVGMQFTILQGSITGTPVYQETFTPTTSAYGLVNLDLGTGTVVSGTFANIDWSAGPYFIETAIDAAGGTTYTVMGTSELMSVPYALYSNHSGTADSIVGGLNISATDTANWNNDLVDDADADATNELNTTVVLNGTNLETTDAGGTISTDLSSLMINADTLWAANGADVSNLNTGNVGVGITTPNEKLHVNDAGTTSFVGITNSTTGATATDGFKIGNNGNAVRLNQMENSHIYFSTNGTDKMIIGASGNVGIGTTAPSATLDVVGDVQIVDGTEGVGKVLTSDANGNATWTGPIGFKATKAANQTVGNAFHAGYSREEFDLGNGWNGNDRYTAPATGLYRFELNLAAGLAEGGTFRTYLYVNNAIRASTTYRSTSSVTYQNLESSFLVYLVAGQVVQFRNTATSINVYGNTSTTTAEYSRIEGWLIK